MKKKILSAIKYLLGAIPFIITCGVVINSLNWGLPNRMVRNIVLPGDDETRKDVIRKITDLSNDNLKGRKSFVIEGKETENSFNEKLRIARRYLLYSENPDEMMALAGFAGINPSTFNFKLKCFQYGGGYLYPMGAMVALGRLVNGEQLKVSMQEMVENLDTIDQMYVWGRAFNLIVLVIGFAGLFLIFYSKGFTKINSVLFSSVIMTSPVLVNWATVIKPHLMGASFLILSAGVAFYGEKHKSLKKYYFIAMLLAGVACSAQYLMIGAGIIPTVLIIQNRKFMKIEKTKIILTGISISGITFFIFNPYHLFDIGAVLADLERAGSFYHPEFFSFRIPFFALWLWAVGTGMTVVPMLAGLFYKWNILLFFKRNLAIIITIVFYGYYGGAMCVSSGFQAVAARLFIPMIILLSILLCVRVNKIENHFYRKTIFILIYFAAFINLFVMEGVLGQASDERRPYIEASEYLQQNYHKYDNIYFTDDTPAPYKNPAFSIYQNIKTYNGQLKANELLITQSKLNDMKLLRSFKAKRRYFKISFAEKDFFFYEK